MNIARDKDAMPNHETETRGQKAPRHELRGKTAGRGPGRSHFLDAFFQDIRYGARTLYKYPGFTASVVFTLSLGIGANTAIFSLVDAVLLRLLPVASPEELYSLGSRQGAGTMSTDRVEERDTTFFSYPMVEGLRDHNGVFSGLTAMSSFTTNAYVSTDRSSADGGVEQADAHVVSGNFFSVLGVQAAVGRTFTAEDDQVPGAHPVAVVSYAYWSRKFGRSPAIIGTTLQMNGTEYTILGVAPPAFFGVWVGASTDIWVPMMMQPQMMREESLLEKPDVMWLRVVGRLKPGVTEAQAGARTTDLFRELLREEAGSEITPQVEAEVSKKTIELVPFGKGFSFLRNRYARPLLMLTVVVGLVLLIACANVGNLLLARASARQKEVALRLAVGSSRTRMLRQLLTESVMLSLAGGLVGLLVARWAIDLLLTLISSRGVPLPLDTHLDARVLAFTLLMSCAAAILFGVAPAFHTTRVDLISSLRNQGSATDARQQTWRLRRILVVSQVAVSLVLLIGAGLFLRSLQNLRNLNVGFPAEEVLQLEIDPQGGGYEEKQLPDLYRELIDRIGTIPEVRSVSLSLFALFSNHHWRSHIVVDGYEPQSDADKEIQANMVTPGYFETVGIPLLTGRTFEWRDRQGAPLVAVVNETLARHFFGGDSPLGRTFQLDEGTPAKIEIVGLVKDLKYNDLREETPRLVYFPVLQKMDYLSSVEVRSGGDPTMVVPQVRQAIRDVAQDLPVLDVTTASEQVDRSLRQEKLLSRLTGFFGLLALLLASIGIYGVMAQGVAQRTNEIGIRMALGARRTDVMGMILRDVAIMVSTGTAFGLVAALLTTRLVASMLFGLSETDPVTVLTATAFLVFVAVFAGYLPASRASRMHPVVALRYE